MEGVLATGITRRDFLRYATTAATAVGALSLAGCGSQRASEATTGSATSTSAAALFNYALNESPQALDPALVNDFGSLELCANIYEGLFRFKGETCDVEPCLAESYDVSDDGLTYTFKLREGVTFHDGTAFDASAVVTNFERQMNGNAAANMPRLPAACRASQAMTSNTPLRPSSEESESACLTFSKPPR